MPQALQAPRSLAEAHALWPSRQSYFPSPADWRDEIFYFLLPDRFSDGKEGARALLDHDLTTAAGRTRIKGLRGSTWNWEAWKRSGSERFQGGTLAGIRSKLDYLKGLGITTLWIAPIFRQRVEENTYHGYGIQDFFEVDPRFGTREELIELVDAAHRLGLRVILDVIFNHTGCNFLYDLPGNQAFEPPYVQNGGYQPVWPRSGMGHAITGSQGFTRDDFTWPSDLQDARHFVCAGRGDLGAGDIRDDFAEHKRTDFCSLRKLNLYENQTLSALIQVYQYWIALTDVDGFRIDTFKHVTLEQARNFCNALKEYAEILGKEDFFLVAEIAGGNLAQDLYLDIAGRNLNACLDIGEQRDILCRVGKGLEPPGSFFAGFDAWNPDMGSHRNWGSQHLSISNDHDHVFGSKTRISADASNDHQAVPTLALQLFTLGIPCLYYGTEQGLAGGAEPEERRWLPGWGSHDCFLREAMFGPEHPRASGYQGCQGQADQGLPGFGPHGTTGQHVFNPKHPIYARTAQLAETRARFKPLRRGRQYVRAVSVLSGPFVPSPPGELLAWSRIFDDQEVMVIVNTHGLESRGGRIQADANLSADGWQVVACTDPHGPAMGTHLPMNASEPPHLDLNAQLLGPSEVLVLANRASIESMGGIWRSPS